MVRLFKRLEFQKSLFKACCAEVHSRAVGRKIYPADPEQPPRRRDLSREILGAAQLCAAGKPQRSRKAISRLPIRAARSSRIEQIVRPAPDAWRRAPLARPRSAVQARAG